MPTLLERVKDVNPNVGKVKRIGLGNTPKGTMEWIGGSNPILPFCERYFRIPLNNFADNIFHISMDG
jgi:hypothetical protein